VLGGISLSANAVSVFLSPADQTVSLGDQVSVDLMWDFTGNAALGGGTDFAWDPAALSLVSIVFDNNFGTGPGQFDPAFTRCDNEECSGEGFIDGLATGNFAGLGDPGPIYIATITFDTLAAGSFLIDISEDAGIAGPFISAITFGPYTDLTFGDATINVDAGVPLPAAAWLMIGGLGALLGRRRKA
jgi:hypothetical protein